MAHFHHAIPAVTLTGKCPSCGNRLVVRSTRDDESLFIGCNAYPRCRFTCAYDSTLQALHRRLLVQPQTADQLSPLALDRALKTLVAVCHPDRWHDSPVATELCKAINALRQRVQGGEL